MQAGYPFDPGGRATRVDVIFFFFLCEAFSEASFFLLTFVQKIEVEADAKTLAKVGVGDEGVLVHHVDPGIIVASLHGVFLIVGGIADKDAGQANDVGLQEYVIAVLFFQHPGGDIVGVGKIAGGGKNEGVAGAGVDPIVAAGV